MERFLNPPKGLFEGYDAENSFVNIRGTEGRCNPKFIPYQYVANSPECCIAEINPGIDSVISVADIKATQNLRISKFATGGIYDGKSQERYYKRFDDRQQLLLLLRRRALRDGQGGGHFNACLQRLLPRLPS